jgi:hypothetical protein
LLLFVFASVPSHHRHHRHHPSFFTPPLLHCCVSWLLAVVTEFVS